MRRMFLIVLGLGIGSQIGFISGSMAEAGRSGGVRWYTVSGERHGISHFKIQKYPEVEYEPGDSLSFDRYHSYDVMNHWLHLWEKQYPGLIKVEEVALSFEGRPILQSTMTNRHIKDTEKPAAYFEGGRHSGEVTSSESVLWLMRTLLDGYGKDEAVTRLLDTRTIYFRPQNNPDGSELYLRTAQSNRSTVRPHDDDGDGLLDEDSPEDLNGDGVIHTMRWKARPGEKGNAVPDTRDPSGRLMRRVREGTGDWCVASEGIDSDEDGKYNEDGIGGLDLHRNYPENWRPDRGMEATGRGYTQSGAGAYPLSEPETRSVVVWLLSHPNVSVINSMDTRVPMHLRPPSTSRSREGIDPKDLYYYLLFDSIGMRITGYPWAGDVYETYHTRNLVDDWTGEVAGPAPLFGHGPDFGYSYFGAIWYGDELWNGGRMADANQDGVVDDADALIWDDEENGGRGFREWTAVQHPQLGRVEIGGFHPKFFSQNPPAWILEPWIEKQARFNLEMAMHLPLIEMDSVAVHCLSARGDSATYRIRVRWTNRGGLPTALNQARKIKIVPEDRVRLEFEDSSLVKGQEVRILSPHGRDPMIEAGHTDPGESKHADFIVRIRGIRSLKGRAILLSTRGGSVSAEFLLLRP